MARAIADIAERARTKKLLPDDVQGGTFTITNPGGFGTFHGTPIISQPQVGILGTYALVKRPWVVQDELGQDVIAIRPMMNITLTYDHRLVDGALQRPASCAISGSASRAGTRTADWRLRSVKGAYVMNLGLVPYGEAWELQRSLAGAVSQGAIPDTILLLEHPPTVTTGRRTEEGEVHIPDGAEVEIVETNRGGKSTFHGPGQLVCYPILDLNRHGIDVKKYVRDLEEALIRTLAPFRIEAQRIDGLTGVWLDSPPRKIASIGVHVSRWVTTHGYALNVDLDPAPFTAVDHRVRARGRSVHDDRARARPAGDGGRDARPRTRGARRGVRARARGAPRRRRPRPLAPAGARASSPPADLCSGRSSSRAENGPLAPIVSNTIRA